MKRKKVLLHFGSFLTLGMKCKTLAGIILIPACFTRVLKEINPVLWIEMPIYISFPD